MASANSNDKLIIFKGDDTGGVFGRRLAFTIEAGDGVDLSGCSAEWIFDGIVKTFAAPLVNGETREVFYSHNETRCMALGVRYGTFRIIDAAGKVRTLTNTKPVEVTNDAARCYPGSSDASFVVRGIGDMKHSEFADLEEKEGMTLKEVGGMVNILIRKLKGSVSAFAALLAFGAFADGAITPDTDFGDISPTAKLKAVVEASGAISGIDTNAVDALANSAVVTNALTVATTNRVALLESSKANRPALPVIAGNLASLTADGNLADSEVPATRVPTAAKQLEWDSKRDRTDLSLDTWIAGEGAPESIKGQPQWNEETECWTWDWHTPGGVYESFRTWNASSPDDPGPIELYDEIDIMSGRYFTATRDRIAKESQLTSKADRTMISATNTTFSNAVLAVNVDFATNTTGAAYVAVTNALAGFGFDADALAELPGGKVYGSIGGLLAALAAAAAWLKKNKVQTLKLEDGSVETSADGGVAKLDNFFTESNSLLTATIDARLPYPLYAVPSTGVLKDRAINTTSIASVTVPENFTDLLIRASVASSLSVTMPEAIATKYGDTFPGEAGEYLITITKTGAAEAYVRTIKLEEVA